MQTVSRIIKKIMMEKPFYGLYLIGLNKVFTEEVDTAAVCLNGINFELQLNPNEWKNASNEYKTFLLLHELGHLLFFHLQDYQIWKNKHPDNRLLNICMDLEVNSYIDNIYLQTDIDGAASTLFRTLPHLEKGLGTSKYWEILSNLKQFAQNPQNGNVGNGGKSKSVQDDYSKLNPKDQQLVKDTLTSSEDIHKEWKKIVDQFLNDPNMSKMVRSQSEYQTKQVAEQSMSSYGKGSIPGHLSEMIMKLFEKKPPVFNWKAFFRRKLGCSFDIFQKKSRRKESKRFEDLFGLKFKKKHKILVAIDTSGSVGSKDFQDFFSEIHHIHKAGAQIHILECDAQITNEYDYNGKTPDKITGRGGTSFIPVINYYNEHKNIYNTLVYLTDGYGDQDLCKPKGQVLWIITSDGNKDSDYPGIKICIPKTK